MAGRHRREGKRGCGEFYGADAGSDRLRGICLCLQNKLAYTLLANHEGNYVSPASGAFQSAAAGADWAHAPGFYLVLTDQPGKESWPITGASFILMHTKQDKPDQAKAALEFFSCAMPTATHWPKRLIMSRFLRVWSKS